MLFREVGGHGQGVGVVPAHLLQPRQVVLLVVAFLREPVDLLGHRGVRVFGDLRKLLLEHGDQARAGVLDEDVDLVSEYSLHKDGGTT